MDKEYLMKTRRENVLVKVVLIASMLLSFALVGITAKSNCKVHASEDITVSGWTHQSEELRVFYINFEDVSNYL